MLCIILHHYHDFCLSHHQRLVISLLFTHARLLVQMLLNCRASLLLYCVYVGISLLIILCTSELQGEKKEERRGEASHSILQDEVHSVFSHFLGFCASELIIINACIVVLILQCACIYNLILFFQFLKRGIRIYRYRINFG